MPGSGFTVRQVAARTVRPRKPEPALASDGRRCHDGGVPFDRCRAKAGRIAEIPLYGTAKTRRGKRAGA